MTWKYHIGEIKSRPNKACYAIRSVKPFMSLDVLRSKYCSYVHSIISYGIIFSGNSHHSEEIFKIQKKRIITNSSKNVSSKQPFKKLSILPIQSQCIFSIPLFVTKIRTNFCLTHRYIKSIQGKLRIYIYLQQTSQYIKRVFIT